MFQILFCHDVTTPNPSFTKCYFNTYSLIVNTKSRVFAPFTKKIINQKIKSCLYFIETGSIFVSLCKLFQRMFIVYVFLCICPRFHNIALQYIDIHQLEQQNPLGYSSYESVHGTPPHEAFPLNMQIYVYAFL